MLTSFRTSAVLAQLEQQHRRPQHGVASGAAAATLTKKYDPLPFMFGY
jgi:hypothetical protein